MPEPSLSLSPQLACLENHLPVIHHLCECGANPNLIMTNDFTPLDFAAEYNNWDACEVLCSYGATRKADASLQASKAGHTALANWLEASEEWTTPLHYLNAITPDRAIHLLREGADVHACVAPNRPSPYKHAYELYERGEAPEGSAADLVLAASEPWSIATHHLFPDPSRDRATELVRLGWLLSRSAESPYAEAFEGREQALMDAWLVHVMPYAVDREEGAM